MQDDNHLNEAYKAETDMPSDKAYDEHAVEKPITNRIINKQTKRITMLWLGWFLLIIAPIIGAIPGPGFIIVFPIGLALVLKNSRWAKGLYIKFKRKFPDYGRWTDWALRRKGQKEMPPLPPLKEQVKRLFGR